VHQALHGARDEPIVHEDVLVDVEASISTLEITGAVAGHTMTQREVLRPRGGADRIGLNKTEPVECALERRRREESASDRCAPQLVDGHSPIIRAV
jgi:hypothetical protein